MHGRSVRAILDVRKTQTRRPVKPQPSLNPISHDYATHAEIGGDGALYFYGDRGWSRPVRCPYGAPGDRLWVRETFGLWDTEPSDGPERAHVFYRATEDGPRFQRWRPSIFMPRWASRLTLELTSVRVERVQAISEADAIAEGVGHEFVMNAGWPDYRHIENGVCTLTQDTPEASFGTAWDSMHAKSVFAWDRNPWVWVLTFRRVTP